MLNHPNVARSFALVAFLFAGLSVTAARTAALDSSERGQLIPAICSVLQTEYIYPNVASRMVEALQAHAQHGDYASISNGKALAARLTTDLRAISRDGHLGAEYHPEGAHTDPENWSVEDLEGMRTQAERDNFDFRKVERMIEALLAAPKK